MPPLLHSEPAESGDRLSAFVSLSYVFPVGFAFHPGVEFTIASLSIGEKRSVEIGVGNGAEFAVASWVDRWSYVTLGAEVFGLVAITFDALSLALAPGIGFNYYFYSGDPSHYADRPQNQLGFVGFAGLRYRITQGLAIRFDVTYWGSYAGTNVGIGLQFL